MRSWSILFLGLSISLLITPLGLHATSPRKGLYVPSQSCRVLDTRASAGGTGSKLQAHTVYGFGTDDASIRSASQRDNASGCGIDVTRISALNVMFYVYTPAASGYVSTAPMTILPASPVGAFNTQLPVNGIAATIPVVSGSFAVRIDGTAAVDVAVDVLGYWLDAGMDDPATGSDALALGWQSEARGADALALGASATATGDAAVSVGMATTASGAAATALGYETRASGAQSTALGSGADTNLHAGAFVYADASGTATRSTADNQFMVRAAGGVVLYTSAYAQGTAQSTGVYLSPGSGSWSTLSDRKAKDTVAPVDGRDVLDRVVAMPLATWHYKAQDTKYRHMGPMAQDFYAAFGLGESDTGIDTIDADGVALAAIQGLNAKLEARAELAQRDADMAARDARIAKLEAQIAALVAAMDASAGSTR